MEFDFIPTLKTTFIRSSRDIIPALFQKCKTELTQVGVLQCPAKLMHNLKNGCKCKQRIIILKILIGGCIFSSFLFDSCLAFQNLQIEVTKQARSKRNHLRKNVSTTIKGKWWGKLHCQGPTQYDIEISSTGCFRTRSKPKVLRQHISNLSS